MSHRFRSGLVVGKFSPLHRGHELVLQTALDRCERVFALSYSSPERPGCGAAMRASWMKQLFPQIEHLALDEGVLAELRAERPGLPLLPDNAASELEQRCFVAQICRQVWGVLVEAVFTSETYGEGFAAELTRQFRSFGVENARVVHVLVDQARGRVPISARAIRAEPALGRRFLSPVVYAAFVQRVCVLGGESSGKTTLTRALAERFRTTHAAEYGRELWQERGGTLCYDDLLTIARTQVAREEQAARHSNAVMFGDTSPLTTLFYCLEQFGRAEPELYGLAERRYDLTLLCAPDFPFVQDGTRRDVAFRARQHDFYLRELARRHAPFLLVRGTLAERIAEVERALEGAAVAASAGLNRQP